MASKLKVNSFVLLRVALLVLQVTLSTLKNSVNSVVTLRFRSGKESFGFKKLLELVWTLVYVFQRSMKSFHAVANLAIANRRIKLNYLRFVYKEIALNELNLLFLLTHDYRRLIRHQRATSFSSARAESKTQQNTELVTFALSWCANIFVGCSVIPTFFSADHFLFWFFPLY